jgi:D-sedoheptulose 7-phosphate isomerase
VKQSFLDGRLHGVTGAVDAIVNAFRRGHKLLLFGNGGSAADAQHIAAEFVNRLARNRPPLPAVALTTDSSILTSVANDDAFDEIFARQVQALGTPGDVAWGISTSGVSPNVVRGLEEGGRLGLVTVGLTGGSGGSMGRIVDHWIHVDHAVGPRVQEAHIAIAHIICQLVEEVLFPDGGQGVE